MEPGPEAPLQPQPDGRRRIPPGSPPAPPGTAESGAPAGGEQPRGMVGREYLGKFFRTRRPEKVWEAIRDMEPPHTVKDGEVWFRRSDLLDWLVIHGNEISRRRRPRHIRRSAR